MISLCARSFSMLIRSMASSCSLMLFSLRDFETKTTIASRIAAPKNTPRKTAMNVRWSTMTKFGMQLPYLPYEAGVYGTARAGWNRRCSGVRAFLVEITLKYPSQSSSVEYDCQQCDCHH